MFGSAKLAWRFLTSRYSIVRYLKQLLILNTILVCYK